MKQLVTEKNRELASLLMKRHRGKKLSKSEMALLRLATTRFNARAAANARRSSRNIDWESGKDARAEAAIARATKGAKKVKKEAAEEAARAHGDVKEGNLTKITEQGLPGLAARGALAAWKAAKTGGGIILRRPISTTVATQVPGAMRGTGEAIKTGGTASLDALRPNRPGAEVRGRQAQIDADRKNPEAANQLKKEKADAKAAEAKKKADAEAKKKADARKKAPAAETGKQQKNGKNGKPWYKSTGAKVAGGVGAAYLAHKALSDDDDD